MKNENNNKINQIKFLDFPNKKPFLNKPFRLNWLPILKKLTTKHINISLKTQTLSTSYPISDF